jgi:hypothetical protein
LEITAVSHDQSLETSAILSKGNKLVKDKGILMQFEKGMNTDHSWEKHVKI